MANATDDLIRAENWIKDLLMDQDKAIEICRWLFSFNNIEKSHKIKCHQTKFRDIQTKVLDIRFCIDRGTDCETKKIKTNFLIFRTPFQLRHIRLMNANYPYLRNGDRGYYRIGKEDCQELPIETLKKHILESYCLKLKQLKLASDICQDISKPYDLKEVNKVAYQKLYLPTRMDFEKASQMIGRKGQDIPIENILDKIEINCKKEGYYLKENWRTITETNIYENWSKKRSE